MKRHTFFWLILVSIGFLLGKHLFFSEKLPQQFSDLKLQETFSAQLPELIQEFEVKTLVHVACLNQPWLSEVPLGVEKYVGIDNSLSEIDAMRKKSGCMEREFHFIDVIKDPIPKADLAVCFTHLNGLTRSEIRAALMQLKKSGAKYLLLAQFPAVEKNRKGKKGSFHPVNWQINPYRFPKPLKILKGEEVELALWKLESII